MAYIMTIVCADILVGKASMPDPIAVSSQSPGLLSDFRRGIKLNKLWCLVMSQLEPARSFPVLSDVTSYIMFTKYPSQQSALSHQRTEAKCSVY